MIARVFQVRRARGEGAMRGSHGHRRAMSDREKGRRMPLSVSQHACDMALGRVDEMVFPFLHQRGTDLI